MTSVYYHHIRLGGTMYKKIVSQTTLDGLITLPEVKAHCRVFNDFENDYLSSLIPVYLDQAQGYTGRMLTTGSAVVVVHSWQSQVLLPYGNVTEVTKLVLDGTESTAFTFDDVSQIISINAPYATARIEFNAGYETLPVVVKQAVLVMINTAFNNRDDLVVVVRYDPLTALGKAFDETWDKTIFSLRMIGKMLTGEVSWRNLSGPVTIADYAGQSARLGIDYYLKFMALVSISLGVLNLLPIPVLDGGHLMYHMIEVVRRRPLSERAMEISQQVGLSILFVLMTFAFFNDMNRLFSG